MGVEASGARERRWQLIDLLRGGAILAMVVFHIGWDLYYFGYSDVDVTSVIGWVVFQKAILSTFLLLAGAGLVLAHGRAIRWGRFWRRLAIIAGAALLVTAGTYWQFPDYFVFFGVLHAMALFSLLGLAFLRLPPLLTAVAGAVVIAANFVYSNPIFTSRELGWIGFWPVSPETTDVVPIFPWFGAVLLGIAGMRLILSSPLAAGISGWRSVEPAAEGLALIGRWSLPIYLLHQPLLIGGFMVLAQLQAPAITPPVAGPEDRFVASCRSACDGAGNEAGYCQRLCQCALEQAEPAGLVGVTEPNAEQSRQLGEIGRLCGAMAVSP